MSTRRHFLLSAVPAVSVLGADSKRSGEFRLPVRSRVEAFKGSGIWNEVQFEQSMAVPETAVIICDVWDNHWCSGAAHRVSLLAPKINATIEIARRSGLRSLSCGSRQPDVREHAGRLRRLPPDGLQRDP